MSLTKDEEIPIRVRNVELAKIMREKKATNVSLAKWLQELEAKLNKEGQSKNEKEEEVVDLDHVEEVLAD